METPGNQPEEFRQHLEDPVHISDALDAVAAEIGSREEMMQKMIWHLDRQAELLEKHHWLRLRGDTLPTEEEAELDEIHETLLNIQADYKKHHSTDNN